MYRPTDNIETKEFIISGSNPPQTIDFSPIPFLGSYAFLMCDETHWRGACLEIGIEEQALVNLSPKMPPLIIVQDLVSWQVIIVEAKLFFLNDLSKWNGYRISFGQDIPVRNQIISTGQP